MLDYKGVSELSGFSINSLRQWKSEGKMPEPDAIVGGSPAWNERTIEKWMAKKAQGSWRSGGSLSPPRPAPPGPDL